MHDGTDYVATPSEPRHNGTAGLRPQSVLYEAQLRRNGAPSSAPYVAPNRRHLAIVFAVIAETVGQGFFESDAVRAVLVSLTLVPAAFSLSSRSVMRWRKTIPAKYGRTVVAYSILCLIGLYGLVLACFNRNDLYYVAADSYHWFVEFVLVAVLTTWVFSGRSTSDIAQVFTTLGAIVGGIGVIVFALGTAGLPMHGGNFVDSLSLWRLDLGKGFPLIPLIFAAALVHSKSAPQSSHRRPPWLTYFVLLFDLLVTFKRTQWISFFFIFPAFLIPRRLIVAVLAIGVPLVVTVSLLLVINERAFNKGVRTVQEALTYNPDYTLDETFNDRHAQIQSVIPFVKKRWWGAGMGAAPILYNVVRDRYEAVHYVHNLYAYQALQLGLIGVLPLAGLVLWILCDLWIGFKRCPEMDWLFRACLLATTALLTGGLMLISIHTVWASIVLGLALELGTRKL